MPRMNWGAPEKRFFETGLDRGVLYPRGAPPLGPVIATNLITNPEFKINIAGWDRSSVGTLAREAEGSRYAGGYTKGPTAGSDWVSTEYVAVVPNQVVQGSIEIKMQGQASDYQVHIMWYNNSVLVDTSSSSIAPSTSLSGSTYTRVSMSSTSPENANRARLQINAVAALTEGNGFRVRDGILTISDKPAPYFSGDTPDTGVTSYEWLGVPHQSTSVQREILTLATPWDGLASVEESGGEAARAYYADGRPFLFLPTPKEYKATLNAYTYPDAFSRIMGLSEIADGMYLDSQPGEAFDLSYRTRIGNAIEGADHGYKIHLVYNATVTPGALNYESLSDSINPSTMSWEVQAIPVRVEGFRPTAHIVIDTRHMDVRKIGDLEELLYGSESQLAGMPDPQRVFDLLNYGDAIIVIDNGDGTFDVEGSYENVYLISEGEFRVDNVDGQDNGDGTFTISTTEG